MSSQTHNVNGLRAAGRKVFMREREHKHVWRPSTNSGMSIAGHCMSKTQLWVHQALGPQLPRGMLSAELWIHPCSESQFARRAKDIVEGGHGAMRKDESTCAQKRHWKWDLVIVQS